MRRLLFISIVVVALAAGSVTVAVAGPGKPAPRGGAVQAKAAGTLHRAAAAYLGLTPRQLRAELRSGKALAQVATAQGKSVDGLKAALLAALKTKVDAAVAAGRIDAARAQRMLERAPARIDRLVERTPGPRARGPKGGSAHGGLLGAAATYLGLARPQLAAELRSGKSLAQVATARGKSVDGLKAALLAALKTKVEAAVAAGRIEAARAQRMLERASARIDRLVERTRTRRR